MKQRNFLIFCLFILFSLTPFQFSKAITVGPVKLEYLADPGQTIEGEVFLINEENETKIFYPVFEGFKEENGERKFLPEAVDLAKWFNIEDEIELDVGEETKVLFKINIPEDAGPGGHYAIMWWSTAPANYSNKPDQNVAVVTRAGILVYLRVSGEVKEDAKIVFSAEDGKRLFDTLPINFVFTFKNEGNVHLKPQGIVEVKDLFGKVKATLKMNEYGVQVLPGNEKSFGAKWESGSIFGLFKAELKIGFGETRQEISKSIWLIIFPWKLAIIIALILLFLIFGLPHIIKRYNRWVINKAKLNMRQDDKNSWDYLRSEKEDESKDLDKNVGNVGVKKNNVSAIRIKKTRSKTAAITTKKKKTAAKRKSV